jgi:hypothetical protein
VKTPLYFISLLLVVSSCYVHNWNTYNGTRSEPRDKTIISDFFAARNDTISIPALSPGISYQYDIGEKDLKYGSSNSEFHFNTVQITLCDSMPKNMVLVDIVISDSIDNRFVFNNVDLLKFIPTLDATDSLIYPEYLLEEFNRFGVVFRKEHDEFQTKSANSANDLDRVYRCKLTNNCLAASKFEFEVTSEMYDDFGQRLNSEINLNQNKIFSHSWFYMDKDLYEILMKIKNPRLDFDIFMEYDKLSDLSESVTVNFDQLRNKIKKRVKSTILEIGHQSKRKVTPINIEEQYKSEFSLLLNNKSYNYSTILDSTVSTSQFKDEGFYTALTPKKFDFRWMKYADSVNIDIIENRLTDAYVEITITGKWCPYNIVIGNVDMAMIDEQKYSGFLFGLNTYPKSRRYNPIQSNIDFDADLRPDELKPYVLLVDKKTGKWVNNQYKGIEKIYLSYESIERDVLTIHVGSYERIITVWMARLKLPNSMREKVRIRNNFYAY